MVSKSGGIDCNQKKKKLQATKNLGLESNITYRRRALLSKRDGFAAVDLLQGRLLQRRLYFEQLYQTPKVIYLFVV